MQAIQLSDYGSPTDLTYTTLPRPEAQAGALRVVIHAAAVKSARHQAGVRPDA